MGRPPSFNLESEVDQRFGFLVADYGMDGPEYSDLLLPGVRYATDRISVWVFLDSGDGAGRRISISVSLATGHGWVKADLPDLVEGAVFAARHRVAWKAHTTAATRQTLDDTAMWLRRLLPALLEPDGADLIRKSNQHLRDRAGNPKRRPPTTTWKYG